MKEEFDINNYWYDLPENRIAKFPLEKRDQSKLLLWNKGDITHHTFSESTNLLPDRSLLVFNDTKVISARLQFQKQTGANIEIFLLHPEQPTRDIQEAMIQTGNVVWQCMIGNKKRWKEGSLQINLSGTYLQAEYYDRDNNMVKFQWDSDDTFADIINKSGKTPLPPYLNRKPEDIDTSRYQTVYSKNNGAVAAPTAGLHFTDNIIEQMTESGISTEYLTLHVSAGTFKPVDAEDFRDHKMHNEQIVVKLKNLKNLLQHHDSIITIGTTSLRILESLYWYGVLLSSDPSAKFNISKTLPYETSGDLTFEQSLQAIISTFNSRGVNEIHGETEIFIYPGYQIRSAKGLFTNFHLPKSTLLLLISAFTGQDWKKVYGSALEEGYRFLSYGDSSLLLR